MRGALVIAGKDLRNIFMSPLFYVVAAVCSVVWWFLFIVRVNEFLQHSAMIAYQSAMGGGGGEQGLPLHFYVVLSHLYAVNLVMIFAVSAITMRLFTEEKRNRTYDLLLTAPVTATEITVGKLIAGTLTAWALLGIALIYPLSLGFFANLDWGPLISSFLGIMLLTAGYVSIGMFASSLTQSLVVAVIVAPILNIMIWFVGAMAEGSNHPATRQVFEHLNVATHLGNFMKGSVGISSTVFLLSIIFLFSFLTQRVVESSRWR